MIEKTHACNDTYFRQENERCAYERRRLIATHLQQAFDEREHAPLTRVLLHAFEEQIQEHRLTRRPLQFRVTQFTIQRHIVTVGDIITAMKEGRGHVTKLGHCATFLKHQGTEFYMFLTISLLELPFSFS